MARKEYSGCIIELRTWTPQEKDEMDAWAAAHGMPTNTFLIGRLRALKDEEDHGADRKQAMREQELQEKIAALEEELHITRAALQRAEGHVISAPIAGLRESYLQDRIAEILESSGAMSSNSLSELKIAKDDKALQKRLKELEELEASGRVRRCQRLAMGELVDARSIGCLHSRHAISQPRSYMIANDGWIVRDFEAFLQPRCTTLEQ